MKLKTFDAYLTEKSLTSEQFDALTDTEKAAHYDALNEENSNIITYSVLEAGQAPCQSIQSRRPFFRIKIRHVAVDTQALNNK